MIIDAPNYFVAFSIKAGSLPVAIGDVSAAAENVSAEPNLIFYLTAEMHPKPLG
jgi:hypothetical protein